MQSGPVTPVPMFSPFENGQHSQPQSSGSTPNPFFASNSFNYANSVQSVQSVGSLPPHSFNVMPSANMTNMTNVTNIIPSPTYNVMPSAWDSSLLQAYDPDSVSSISPNDSSLGSQMGSSTKSLKFGSNPPNSDQDSDPGGIDMENMNNLNNLNQLYSNHMNNLDSSNLSFGQEIAGFNGLNGMSGISNVYLQEMNSTLDTTLNSTLETTLDTHLGTELTVDRKFNVQNSAGNGALGHNCNMNPVINEPTPTKPDFQHEQPQPYIPFSGPITMSYHERQNSAPVVPKIERVSNQFPSQNYASFLQSNASTMDQNKNAFTTPNPPCPPSTNINKTLGGHTNASTVSTSSDPNGLNTFHSLLPTISNVTATDITHNIQAPSLGLSMHHMMNNPLLHTPFSVSNTNMGNTMGNMNAMSSFGAGFRTNQDGNSLPDLDVLDMPHLMMDDPESFGHMHDMQMSVTRTKKTRGKRGKYMGTRANRKAKLRAAAGGVKRFECPTCHKKFTLKQNLKVHIRVHTGERPFKCKYCPKRFKDSRARINHHLTHTGEKPHECVVCQKRFGQRSSFTRHLRSQTHKLNEEKFRRRIQMKTGL